MTYSSVKSAEKVLKKATGHPLLYTLVVQLLGVSFVLVVLSVIDPSWVVSFFWGAFVYILPNAYFTYYAFRYRDARHSYEITRSFYTGEFGKHALATVCFALVFIHAPDVNIAVFFAAYGCLIVLQWYVAYQISKRFKN